MKKLILLFMAVMVVGCNAPTTPDEIIVHLVESCGDSDYVSTLSDYIVKDEESFDDSTLDPKVYGCDGNDRVKASIESTRCEGINCSVKYISSYVKPESNYQVKVKKLALFTKIEDRWLLKEVVEDKTFINFQKSIEVK